MKIQYIFELCGTALFASSGALIANDKSNADWFGVTFIGFITAIGGGSVRDILLGSYPLVWINDINIMYAIFVGIVLTSLAYNQLKKHSKNLFILETIAVAMFTILGTEKALQFGVNPIIASVMGMFSAVMGGVLRDVLTNDTPVLFRKEIYASACMAGAFLYAWLNEWHIRRNISFPICMLLIIVIRVLSVKYDLTLPKFRKSLENQEN